MSNVLKILPLILSSSVLAFTPGAAAYAEEDWEFSVTPYVWVAGPEGEIGAGPDIGVEFDNVLDELDGFLMGKVEARYNRFGAIADFDYVKISGDRAVSFGDAVDAGADVVLDVTGATFAGYYRAYEDESFNVDVIAGARLTALELSIDGAVNNQTFVASTDEDWWDPIIGVRGHWQSSGRLGFTGYGDYGGFGVQSDAVWQIYLAADYDLTKNIALSLGYREYGVDFADRERLDYDIRLSGPQAGLTFTF